MVDNTEYKQLLDRLEALLESPSRSVRDEIEINKLEVQLDNLAYEQDLEDLDA